MTKEDFEQLRSVADKMPHFEKIGVFSPIREGERKIFPTATALPRWRWDLNKPGRRRFDLLVAANVFMYSPDPLRWFRNVFASCRYFLFLDIIRRQRNDRVEFGVDGDRMRYSIGGIRPRVDTYFDLSTLGDRLLAYRTFFGGANPTDNDPLHVIAVFRGDLARPLLRIDDYPTGIRPILPDLSPLHDIVEKAETRGLRYHLGIVPALLDDDMVRFLRGLKNMVPTVHGYDHAYPRYAPVLESKGDPYNERTVGVFDEFKAYDYQETLARLKKGRGIFEEKLGKAPAGYIPPCNIGNRKTGRALMEAGFQYYLSEKRIPGCELPWIKSDFYGQSPNYDYKRPADVVTLHTTWEWDVTRKGGDARALDRLLDHLKSRSEQERERGLQLAEAVNS